MFKQCAVGVFHRMHTGMFICRHVYTWLHNGGSDFMHWAKMEK